MNYTPTLCDHLHTCADLPTAKKLHFYATTSGFYRHTFVANLLVRMYGRCGDVDRAYTIFSAIEHKDAFSWNIMIAAYAANGHLEQARGLFECNPERNVATWTTLISGYGKVGDVESARLLFDALQHKTRASWNAMISVYGANGYCSEAFEAFQGMLLHGVRPNQLSFIIKLPGDTISLRDKSSFEALYRLTVECGLQSNPPVVTVLVVWLSKLGMSDEAEDLFQGVVRKDVVLCTAMIGVYAENGDLQSAAKIFSDLQIKDVPAWNAMIKAYAENGFIQQAELLFEKIPQRNLVTWCTMVAAYARNRLNCTKAVKTFCLMDLHGARPNRVAFLEVLEACGGGLLSIGRIIHGEIIQLGLENDVRIATAIVSMYGNCSSLADTKSTFDGLTTHPNVVAWTSLVTANAQLGHWKTCVEVFHAMLLQGVAPNQVTFLAILSACSRCGELTRAVYYCANMNCDYGCEVTQAHYVCLLDMFSRAGFPLDCQDLIYNMPYHPGIAAWTNLLSSSRGISATNSALAAAEQLHSLHPGNSELPYVLLSNAFTR